MKRTFLLEALSACIAIFCVNISPAGDAVTSSDFINAWNSGSPSIVVSGDQIAGTDITLLMLENPLNPFSGATLTLTGARGRKGIDPNPDVLYPGASSLTFAPGWDSGLDAAISNIGIFLGTNGAVSFIGNGTGAHSLAIDNAYFYSNTGTIGGAVNVQTQIQSDAANTYILTDNDFLSNSAASGGAVAMAANNSIFSDSRSNEFSVIDTAGGTGTVNLLFGMNQATAGNGGGLYFMGNNALGVANTFTSSGYTFYQNSASGLGGGVFIGALNGNAPSRNMFSVTGSNFIENQAASGGAVATVVDGGSRDVDITLEGLFGNNIASGNGGAIYNAVGTQSSSPFGGEVTITAGGPFSGNRAANGGAIYNDFRPGQAKVELAIVPTDDPDFPTQFFSNTVSGNGGAIYNTAGDNNPGTAVVNIADGINFYGNSANYGGAIYNDGAGVVNLNTEAGGKGISFTDNSASASANGADIYQASASAVINITGTGLNGYGAEAVNVNGGIAGIGTINQQWGTLLTLGGKSQNFDFKGVFNQQTSSVLNAYGLMFGGTNNLAGVANIHNALDSVYFNANMAGYSRMNYSSASTDRVSITAAAGDSAPGIRFTGEGATVSFTREGFDSTNPANLGAPMALFTLEGKLDNGQANAVEFSHSDVAFGSTDFTGGTEYRFWDKSVINLAGPLAPYQQYAFSKLTTNDAASLEPSSSLLSFRAGNDQGSLLTDAINVLAGNSVGRLDLGRVYVNDANGTLTGRSRVILGDRLVFENDRSQYVATSNGTYKVTTVDDQYIQFANALNSNTDTTVNPDGGTTTTTKDGSGNTTTTTTTPDGGAVTTTQDSGGNSVTATVDPDGGAGLTHSNSSGEISSSATNPDGTTETTIIHADGGKTVATTSPDGSAGLEHTDSDGNKTTVAINPDGSGTITTTPADGGPGSTTDVSAGGSAATVSTADGDIAIDPSGGETTATFTGNNGSSATVTTDPDDDSTGSSSQVTDSGGSVIETSTGSDGSATTTGTTPGDGVTPGSSATVVTAHGGNTTTTVTTPDGGGGGSTTTVITDQNGGGSTVTNPDGSEAGTAIGADGGATGSVTTPDRTILVLNDVNALTKAAEDAGMSPDAARNFQIGRDETYAGDSDLASMAEGEFSVYGAEAGTRTSTLSGLNGDGTTKQSLFNIDADGTIFKLEDMTVQDASSRNGGSVLNMNNADSTATLANLAVQGNTASGGGGGALRVLAGTVISTNVDYIGNRAAGNGGAIANGGNGNMSVRGGSFIGNEAVNGGAIYNGSAYRAEDNDGDPDNNPGMTIASGAGLAFTGNRATGDGGAIYNDAAGKLTLIADSFKTDDPDDGSIVFSGNTADGNPNDIHNDGELIVTGSGGTIIIGGGISGGAHATISKEGESTLVLGADADNSRFTGAFGQTKGVVDADGKFFGGTSAITGGVLNWNPGAAKEDSAILQVADGGTITVYGDLRLANRDDIIAQEAATNLYGNIDLAGGTLYLTTQDRVMSPDGVVGTVDQSDGYLIVGGADMAVPAGVLRQTGGVARFENQANVSLGGATPDSGLLGGDIVISNATLSTNRHAFNYGPGDGSLIRTSGSLAMGGDALLAAADGVPQTHTFAGKFGLFSETRTLDGKFGLLTGLSETTVPRANFSVDLDARAFRSDVFVFGGGTATEGVFINGHPEQNGISEVTATEGTVVLSGLNLITAPTTAVVPFTIMSATGGVSPGITFTAAMSSVDTPIGPYSLLSLGAGLYELRLLGLSPRVYRGQAATLAAVSGQSHVNSLLFDHVHLDSFDRADDSRPAPWQFIREGRGLWAKPYFSRESLPFGGDVGDVDNDVYGVVLGMDFPALSMAGGWKFLPTVFAAYNGGRQQFADVEASSSGGQAGFMGTFSRGPFAASVMGYAGGYQNDMKVAGFRDKPDNWFAGAAAKAAYSIHAGDNLIFQPYALAAYNVFGDQKWDSDYGSIHMETGGFRGWSAAPGVAAEYSRGGWSVQASAHYMFNFRSKVTGRAGSIDLRKADRGKGYLEYGLGASRKISASLSVEGKATFRSGSGAKSYGGHIGVSWKF